ncbi:hypothetical protein ACLKA6_008803 [Drosophila palustris]
MANEYGLNATTTATTTTTYAEKRSSRVHSTDKICHWHLKQSSRMECELPFHSLPFPESTAVSFCYALFNLNATQPPQQLVIVLSVSMSWCPVVSSLSNPKPKTHTKAITKAKK